MEEKVNENEAVVEDVVTENNVANETTTEPVVEQAKEEVKEFDPKAFLTPTETETKEDDVKEDVKETTDNVIVWDYDNSAVKKEETETKETLQEQPKTTEESFNWESTGLEGVKSKEDFDKKIEEFKSYESKIKENEVRNASNEKINKLEDFLKLDDKELLKRDLELQGFDKEKLEDAMSTYEYNNTISIEAQKIRNTVNKAINAERHKELNTRKSEEAKLQKEQEESIAALKDHLNNTETMFGFKMAKDEASLNNVREKHFKYITSGDFLNDIMASNTNLSEAAWLWKNKETLLNAMNNKGYQKGKQEILDNIQRPEISGTTRILDPTGKTNEFNPNAFIFGE